MPTRKRSKKKGHPAVLSAYGGYLALLPVGGTLKTRLRLKQVQRLIPPTAAMLSGTEWGPKLISFAFVAISRSRAVPLKTGHKLRKERINGSAEYPIKGYKLRDFPSRPLFASSTGKP